MYYHSLGVCSLTNLRRPRRGNLGFMIYVSLAFHTGSNMCSGSNAKRVPYCIRWYVHYKLRVPFLLNDWPASQRANIIGVSRIVFWIRESARMTRDPSRCLLNSHGQSELNKHRDGCSLVTQLVWCSISHAKVHSRTLVASRAFFLIFNGAWLAVSLNVFSME